MPRSDPRHAAEAASGNTKRLLFICGSINQTTQMHQIAAELPEHEAWFTPFYADGYLELARRGNLLEPTILGKKLVRRCLAYLEEHGLPVDFRGERNRYDLVVTCSDLVIPRNIRGSKIVLVQEGMTDPETMMYRLVRALPFLPPWLASTATTGTSNLYDRFCVASEGYRDLFIRKGADPEKLVVTGIPNFDHCASYLRNAFPLKGYVLVCTSDSRETWAYENRKKFIREAVRIAAGRQLVFKLHPNEKIGRAAREIRRYAPGALIYTDGSAEEMIANCDVLVTRYSSTVYVGLALGKEVHSCFKREELRRLLPLQNGCAAKNIAGVCNDLLGCGTNVSFRPAWSYTLPAASSPLTTEADA